MKRLFIAGLLAFAPFTWALDQAGSQQLANLQQRWAQIQYQTPKDKRAEAFEKLAADASTLVHQHPGSAEPLIWEASSTAVGREHRRPGGAEQGQVGQGQPRRGDETRPNALQGSAYTSLGTLYDQVPGWPIGFGDSDKADTLLRKALQINPNGIDSNYFWPIICSGKNATLKPPLPGKSTPGAATARPRTGRSGPAWRYRCFTQGHQGQTGLNMRLLLVEDDTALGEGICDGLRQEGYTLDWLRDGLSGLHALQHEVFDLVILDLGLPRLGGIELLRRVRAGGNSLPVLILTARDATEDRISGLDAGADDYLVKPFDLNELKARLRALLRRSAGRAKVLIEHAGVSLDPATQQVHYNGVLVILTPKEYRLLHELLAQPGKVFTRERLTQLLYGWDEEPESNTLEVNIYHLRKKLFNGLIRTVRGIGYLVEAKL